MRWKLIALLACGAVAVALITAAGFTWLDVQRSWQNLEEEVAAISVVVADQVGPALTLGDRKGAGELLNSLRVAGLISDAVLYDSNGKCFGAFHRNGEDGCPAVRSAPGRHGDTLVQAHTVRAGAEALGTLAVTATVPSTATVMRAYMGGAGLIMTLTVCIALLVAAFLQSGISRPILAMTRVAERITRTHNFRDRVSVTSSDELGVLADSFNAMLEEVLKRDLALGEQTQRLRDQVAAKERAHAELAEAQQRLIVLSRQSGMAEVATGVLHNVGNVLSSVNSATDILCVRVHDFRVDNLAAAVALMEQHRDHLAEFLTLDAKGQRLLPYLAKLAKFLQTDRAEVLRELTLLRSHVDHIKQIVATQQSYAKVAGLTEEVSLCDLVEDAFRIIEPSLERHQIRLERNFQNVPSVTVEKHKVLQILLNLLRNAKEAIKENGRDPRLLQVRIYGPNDSHVRVEVKDSGIGVSPENLTRIFSHGFTTKKDGHGFGLHSGALDAKQMGGSLWAESDGPQHGATFTLELPTRPKLERHLA